MTRSSASVVEAFTLQTEWCERMDSPIYATLLAASRDSITAGGIVDDIVHGFEGDAVEAAVALRFMGGVHRLVLMGLAPGLADQYPSTGGTPDFETIVPAFMDAVESHPGYLSDALSVAPQTNDIGRSALLLPGLFDALDGDAFDIRLLEIGSSAGLNLLLDRFRYEVGDWSWGDPSSPAVVKADLTGTLPQGETLSIVERSGCDVKPLDVQNEEDELRLLSFVWPDHLERFHRTRGAIEIAHHLTPTVDRADASTWLEDKLAQKPKRGVATVVQHSVMWQYLPPDVKQAVSSVIATAGESATRKRPLVHVAFEPRSGVGSGFEVSVTRWPGGERRVVGSGQAHGHWVKWG